MTWEPPEVTTVAKAVCQLYFVVRFYGELANRLCTLYLCRKQIWGEQKAQHPMPCRVMDVWLVTIIVVAIACSLASELSRCVLDSQADRDRYRTCVYVLYQSR